MDAEHKEDKVPVINSELDEDAEFKGSRENQEDLLLTAQRYLNIFHQIHIFREAKRAEFDQQLLDMPEKVRRILAMLPGGRVLLEHIDDLEKQKGIKDSSLSDLIKQKPTTPGGAAATPQTVAAQVVPTVVNAPLELGSDFTKALTDSFSTYSQNLQKLNANIQQIAIQQQNTKSDGKNAQNVDITDAISTLLKENSQQQMDVLKNFGQTLSQTILESQKEFISSLMEKQNSLQPQVIERTIIQKEAASPTTVSPALPETKSNKDDVAPEPEIKSEKAEIKENSSTGKTFVLAEQTKIVKAPEDKKEEIAEIKHKETETKDDNKDIKSSKLSEFTDKVIKAVTAPLKSDAADEKAIEKAPQKTKEPKEEIRKELSQEKVADKVQPKEKTTPNSVAENNDKEKDSHGKKAAKDEKKIVAENKIKSEKPEEPAISVDDTIDIDISTLLEAGKESFENKKEKKPLDDIDAAFALGSAKPKEAKLQPKAAEKPAVRNSDFDNAMLKIKEALSSPDTVSLDEIEITPVSLSASSDTTLAADSLAQAFSAAGSDDALSSKSAAGEHVDESNNQTVQPDNEEWEYVDEDGNPIVPSADDEWEYVDENGNPVSADEEWEYVDENGNPVTPSADDEWEYVDENGNVIS